MALKAKDRPRTNLCLVVKTDREQLSDDEVSLFPSGRIRGRAAPLSYLDHQELVTHCRPLWMRLSETIAVFMSRRFGISLVAARVFARIPVVTITYPLMDRVLRISRIRESAHPEYVRVADPLARLPVDLLTFISAIPRDLAINETMMLRASRLWDMEVLRDQTRRLDATLKGLPALPLARNLNFIEPDLAARIHWKLRRLGARRLGAIPVLGLAYDSHHMLAAGLVGPGGMTELPRRLVTESRVNLAERDEMIGASLAECRTELSAIARFVALDQTGESANLERLVGEVLTEAFPPTHLESIGAEMGGFIRELERFGDKPLLYCEYLDPSSTYFLAAARERGMKTINVQHGVHYSFSVPPVFEELEFQFCDAYVTWGPNQLYLPNHARSIPATPLPSPWLSERAKRWRRRKRGSEARGKLLLPTDRIQEFPPTLSTIRLARIDYLDMLGDWLEGVVVGAVDSGWSVLHKPFDIVSKAALANRIERLQRRFPGRYAVHDRLDKGLSDEVMAEADVVVWDEPGSGFFECLAGGVPAMLLWPAEFVAVHEAARTSFERLQGVGVVHFEVQGLIAQLHCLHDDPVAWTGDVARRSAVAKTLDELCQVDDGWAKKWRRYIERLVHD